MNRRIAKKMIKRAMADLTLAVQRLELDAGEAATRVYTAPQLNRAARVCPDLWAQLEGRQKRVRRCAYASCQQPRRPGYRVCRTHLRPGTERLYVVGIDLD